MTAFTTVARSPSPARLTGLRLALARAAWVAVTLLTLVLLGAGMPLRYAELRQVCTGTPQDCSDRRLLTPGVLQQLQAAGLSADDYALEQTVTQVLTALPWLLLGVLVFALRSDDRMALLTAFTAVLFATRNPFLSALLANRPAWAWVNWVFGFVSWGCFAFFWAAFPNGRFVPRWAGWFAFAWMLAIAVPKEWPLFDWLTQVQGPAWLAFWLFCIGSQVYRYRWVSTPAERLQTRWVVFGVSVGFGGPLALAAPYFVHPGYIPALRYQLLLDAVGFVSTSLIPLSMGLAILRSRLFDVDVIIRRTLVYSALTGVLALTYFGAVLVLQSVFRTLTGESQNQLATVLTTLAIAGLFFPLRARVQLAVDRRFYRRKVDSARTLAGFAAAARDETGLDQLAARLQSVIQDTVQPEHLSLWLGGAASQAQASPATRPAATTRLYPSSIQLSAQSADKS